MVARCRDLTIQINALERELRERAQALAPGLLAISGCGVLGAAVSIGETARAGPFRSKDAFARFTGTAPSPSGQAAAPGSPSQPRRQPA
jgi:transposase